MQVVQCHNRAEGRRVAVVEGDRLRPLRQYPTVYEAALAAVERGSRLADLLAAIRLEETLDYDAVYAGQSEWQLLPPFDHPEEPARCLVTGTGLTHKASAENRQSMHAVAGSPQPRAPSPRERGEEELTDSMKMYRIGLEGGRPAAGQIGAAPEWFYKGCSTILRAHRETLAIPSFAEDGGDEAEIAGAYLVGPDGKPYRIGLVQGNEFSDHVTE